MVRKELVQDERLCERVGCENDGLGGSGGKMCRVVQGKKKLRR